MPQKKYKICLVSDCLSIGGAERVAASLSNFFVSKGIEVHHIIVTDSIEYDYSGEVLNLGKLKNKSNDIFNKIKRFNILKQYIKENNFDFIIEFRVKNNFIQEWITSRFIYKSPTVYTIHSSMINLYLSRNKWLAKSTHKEAFGIVAITRVVRDTISQNYRFKNVNYIYNPVDFSLSKERSVAPLAIDFEYIVSAGRMKGDNKQFDKLIYAYSRSVLPEKNIKLVLLGDGTERASLEKLTAELHLEDKVLFYGQVDNPFKFYKRARFFVLSSLFEGLPMVILESLSCNTPVVAFDCFSGPSEIITDRENGLLVENQNFEKLTQAMNLMIEDEILYQHCKQNASSSIQKFSLENIGNEWLKYLKINVS